MIILITNDDGIYAESLWALYRALVPHHSVTVIAPDRERSAVGHGITLHSPLRANRLNINGIGEGIAVNGTPADCVKLGILELMDTRPDLVISGINPGANLGINIMYSGTVSAAREATLFGVPGIAVSAEGNVTDALDDIANFVLQLSEKVANNGLPPGTILNINFPGVPMAEVAGVRISRLSTSLLGEHFKKGKDPRNRLYYWLGSDSQRRFEASDTDGSAVSNKFISITPIQCDMTNYTVMEKLKTWDIFHNSIE